MNIKPNGMVTVHELDGAGKATGKTIERLPVDAREIVKSGAGSFEAPKGRAQVGGGGAPKGGSAGPKKD